MLRVFMFGSLTVRSDTGFGDSSVVPLTGRLGSLFAYLALARGSFFNRNELATVLWSDGESANAGTFNTTLWRLRRAVEKPPFKRGDLIVSDRRGAIGVCKHDDMTVDVEEFARLTSPGLHTPIERLTEVEVEGLRMGVALYRADILSDFIDEWALREREKHRRTYLNALGRLMELSALARDYPGAIRYAQSILDYDGLREDVHRALMRYLVLAGARALALRQYEICRDLLHRELAIQPMRETIALYQSIANDAVSSRRNDSLSAVEPASFSSATAHAFVEGDPRLPPNARELIERARLRLSQADEQLQLSLSLFVG